MIYDNPGSNTPCRVIARLGLIDIIIYFLEHFILIEWRSSSLVCCRSIFQHIDSATDSKMVRAHEITTNLFRFIRFTSRTESFLQQQQLTEWVKIEADHFSNVLDDFVLGLFLLLTFFFLCFIRRRGAHLKLDWIWFCSCGFWYWAHYQLRYLAHSLSFPFNFDVSTFTSRLVFSMNFAVFAKIGRARKTKNNTVMHRFRSQFENGLFLNLNGWEYLLSLWFLCLFSNFPENSLELAAAAAV